jgi:hypothetical protein
MMEIADRIEARLLLPGSLLLCYGTSGSYSDLFFTYVSFTKVVPSDREKAVAHGTTGHYGHATVLPMLVNDFGVFSSN